MNKLGITSVSILALLCFALLFSSPFSLTGKAVVDVCDYYYDKWHHEPWFASWHWWITNCKETASSVCGNGILETGEQCDTSETLSCTLLGFSGGSMTCNGCTFDTSQCTGEATVDYFAIADMDTMLVELEAKRQSLEEKLLACQQDNAVCDDELICGDGVCHPGQTAENCPQDCEEIVMNVTLSGIVTDSAGSPLSGALVIAENQHIATTNQEGMYAMTFATALKTIPVSVTLSGYLPGEKDIVMDGLTSHEVSFSLIHEDGNDPEEPNVVELSACTVIDESGTYKLVQDITASEDSCFNILADNVIFEGSTFSVIGEQHGQGIIAQGENISITDISVIGFNQSIMLQGSDITVKHVNILDAYVGIAVSGEDMTLSEMNIADVHRGIYLFQSSSVNISDSSIERSDEAGIYIVGGLKNTVLSNQIADAHMGVYIEGTDMLISKNTIKNAVHALFAFNTTRANILENSVSDGSGNGISLFNTHASTVHNNNIQAIEGYGMFVMEGTDAVFSENTIHSTANIGIGILQSSSGKIQSNTILDSLVHGIYISDATDWLLHNITVQESKNVGVVFVNTTQSIINSSLIAGNNQSGIAFYTGSSSNMLINNFIQDNDEIGIYLHQSNENILYNNLLENRFNAHINNSINTWNIPQTEPVEGVNIVGGNGIGGNFWGYNDSSYSNICTGSINNNICDEPFTIDEHNEDKFPLRHIALSNGAFAPMPPQPFCNVTGHIIEHNASISFLSGFEHDDFPNTPINVSISGAIIRIVSVAHETIIDSEFVDNDEYCEDTYNIGEEIFVSIQGLQENTEYIQGGISIMGDEWGSWHFMDEFEMLTFGKICEQNSGFWLPEFNECVLSDEQTCSNMGGTFILCSSPCRHDPDADVCQDVCVSLCLPDENIDESLHANTNFCDTLHTEITDDLNNMNFCEVDADCEVKMLSSWCSFGCYAEVNTHIDRAFLHDKLEVYNEVCWPLDPICVACPDIPFSAVVCESNVCVAS